jgi:hypothetical protein
MFKLDRVSGSLHLGQHLFGRKIVCLFGEPRGPNRAR